MTARTDLVVGRLAVGWRVDAAPDAAGLSRMDGLLAELAGTSLQEALEGVPGHRGTEVCVRRVDVPAVRVRWQGGDAEVVAAVAGAIARAVAGATAGTGTDVVRYPWRAAARTDLVLSVLAGNRDREWAWRLLGLWPAAGWSTVDAVTRTVGAAVAAGPGTLVGLAVAAARADVLGRFMECLGPATLAALAQRAWSSAGGAEPGEPGRRGSSGEPGGVAAVRLATLVQQRSRIVAGTVSVAGRAELATGLAMLAVLEVEPATAASPAGRAAVPLLAAALAMGPARSWSDDPPEGGADAAVRVAPSPPAPDRSVVDGAPPLDGAGPPDGARTPDGAGPPDGARTPDGAGQSDDGGPPEGAGWPEDVAPADAGPGAVGPRSDGLRGSTADSAAAPSGDESVPVDPGVAPESTVDRTTPATTAWGGLLFLLPLVGRLGIPDAAVTEPGAYGLRSVLHVLARRLTARAVPDAPPVDDRDPALLAFCGLAPDTEPPEPLGPTEWADRIDGYADAVVAALAELDETLTLRAVCRRPAAIEADPGWIDVELRLDQVDVAVRRAGLDLDPGWLPWLGCVLRFRYV